VRAIITLIVAVGALTIIMALTLIVITFRRPIVRSSLIVATVGISWSHGNGIVTRNKDCYLTIPNQIRGPFSVIRENNGNGFRRVWEKSSGRDETKYVSF
jgi:hypothetical protein